MIHMDVMDGTFVPNITFGPWIHKAIADAVDVPLDTHLMVADPDRYLEDYRQAGAEWLTVHIEATIHVHRSLLRIRELGAKAGVALNPGTSLSVLEPLLPYLDQVLVMSVNPGFAGQAFIPEAVGRVETVAGWREQGGYNFVISVDGGVGPGNAAQLRSAGADFLVAGSSVYRQDDYAAAINALRS